MINADFDYQLNPDLIDIVEKGIALYFTTEFVATQKRWYWFDKKIINKSIRYRLSYNPITESYQLGTGAFHQNFYKLKEAVDTMIHVRNWNLGKINNLKIGETYEARIRFRLDKDMMPKPFQLFNFEHYNLNLKDEWYKSDFVLEGK